MSGTWNKIRRGLWRNRAKPPTPTAAPLSEAALKAALHSRCQPFTVGGFRPSGDVQASVFGTVRLGPRNTPWPTHNGQPMLPLCQINLSAPTDVPDALSDLALLQLFVAADTLDPIDQVQDSATPLPEPCFAVRAFPTLDGLDPIETPTLPHSLKPFEIAWDTPQDDYANNDVAPAEVDRIANDVYAYDWAKSVYTSKLGGWPATIQSEPWWDYRKTPHSFDYVLQIGPEPKSGWGADALFLARARDEPTKWAMDIQTY